MWGMCGIVQGHRADMCKGTGHGTRRCYSDVCRRISLTEQYCEVRMSACLRAPACVRYLAVASGGRIWWSTPLRADARGGWR